MASVRKRLGAAALAATTETVIYTVPASTTAVLSSVVIANRSGTATTFRLSISLSGGATDNGDYIAYDVPLLGNETISMSLGLTLPAAAVLRAYAAGASVTVSAWGQEDS